MPACLHCERHEQSRDPRHAGLRLCDRCAASPGLRAIYRRPVSPEWDAHLQALADRVKRRLPACAGDGPPPCPPPRQASHKRRRPARVFRLSLP